MAVLNGERVRVGGMVALCVIFVSCGGVLGYYKFAGLKYSTRDYSYYLQFASKLFDSSSTRQFSLNPEGRNMFFMRGPDGALGLQHGIHFEPPKYLSAIAYTAFRTPLAPILLYVLLFTAPIAWASLRFRGGGALVALGLALFILFPSSLLATTDDLRPFILLAPLFLLLVLALAYETSLVEKVIYLNLLLVVREEALLLAFAGLAYIYLLERGHGRGHRESKTLFLNTLAWIAVVLLYFAWDGYPLAVDARRAIPGVAITGVFVVLAILAAKRSGLMDLRQAPLVAFASITFGPILISMHHDAAAGPIALLYRHYGVLLCGAFVGFVVLAAEHYSAKLREPAIRAFSVCAVISLAGQFVGAHSTRATFERAHVAVDDARLVWRVRDSLNARSTEILVDFDAHQAFWDFDHVYAFNRLPTYMVPGNVRYPENTPYVEGLLRDRVECVLVGTESIDAVRRLAESAGVLLVPESSNGSFSFFQVTSPGRGLAGLR